MDLYGPALPPGYVRPSDDEEESKSSSSSDSEPEVKPSKIIGPRIPSSAKNKEPVNRSVFLSSSSIPAIGPELPPHLQKCPLSENISDEECGPTLNEFKNEIDDLGNKKAEIDKRAEKMKSKLDNQNIPIKVNEREEWMTVPDTSGRNQLGAISRCLAPSKSSSKEKHRHSHRHSDTDKKTSEELKKYNKSRRSESLMDMHTKKLKKQEKEEKRKSKKKEERKAFDRDEMDERRFTNKQVNSVLDKAKYLNSRFSAGSKQYL